MPTALVLLSGPSIVSLSRMPTTSSQSYTAGQGFFDFTTTVYLSGASQVVSGGMKLVMMPAVILTSVTRVKL